MNELDFTIELTSEHLTKETEYDLFAMAERRLKELAEGHSDLTGAAINISQPSSGETASLHEVTVVVYGRPNHVAATQKDHDLQIAANNAIEAVERQIRERREKLRQRWEQPGNLPVEQQVDETLRAGGELPLPDTDE